MILSTDINKHGENGADCGSNNKLRLGGCRDIGREMQHYMDEKWLALHPNQSEVGFGKSFRFRAKRAFIYRPLSHDHTLQYKRGGMKSTIYIPGYNASKLQLFCKPLLRNSNSLVDLVRVGSLSSSSRLLASRSSSYDFRDGASPVLGGHTLR
jgi:hypothetical protein